MELVHGRPLDTAGRLEKEIRVYDLLDQLGIAFERVDHEAAMTMEDCAEREKTLRYLRQVFRFQFAYFEERLNMIGDDRT